MGRTTLFDRWNGILRLVSRLICVGLVNTATDSARIGNVDETTGSREQERRQENGEAGKTSGSGRMDTDGDGPPGSAVAGRPPGTAGFL